MATLKTLDPAVIVHRPPYDFLATEAGRTSRGLSATVQVSNGELIAARLVRLADPEDRIAFAQEVSAETGVDTGAAEGALLEMLPGIEGLLRQEQDNASYESRSQVNKLIELAASAQLFHSAEGEGFAAVTVGDHTETWPLRKKGFRSWLGYLYYQEYRGAPTSQAWEEALNSLDAIAQYDGEEHRIFTRVAERDGNIYLDLCNERWEAVEVTAGGWRITCSPPVRFRRHSGMVALPHPVRGGVIGDLRPFVNVANDMDWALLLAWSVAALRPTGPYPLLVLSGEQGSAKSTCANVLRLLLDPNTTPLRSEPRTIQDLAIMANNSWVLALNNLSYIKPWLSDALCTISTGGGFATRKLYSDVEEVLFSLQRPITLNGIEELATRGDLLDRSLVLSLPAIPVENRRSEAAFWTEFEAVRPRILGALLDAASAALRNLPSTQLDDLPRLADFALWATASEPACNLAHGFIVSAYNRNRLSANDLALDSSPLAQPLREMVCERDWECTYSELLGRLNRRVEDAVRREHSWPKSNKALANALRRLAPNLRTLGIEVDFLRECSRERRRMITIRALPHFTGRTVRNGQMALSRGG